MMRDILKTLSFAVLHFSVGFGITYWLTGSIAIATGVALLEPLANTIVFFLHERAWHAADRFLRRRRSGAGRAAVPGTRRERIPVQVTDFEPFAKLV